MAPCSHEDGKVVGSGNKFAVKHNCSTCPASNMCVSLLERNKVRGCYTAEALMGFNLDSVCFQNYYKDGQGCSLKTCGEKRSHIHANLGKTSEEIKNILMLQCAGCHTLPSDLEKKQGAGPHTYKKMDHVQLDVGGSGPKTTIIEVSGICCPSEVPIIENILRKLPGVEKISVNVTMKTTTVVHDPLLTKPEELVHAINGASLGARLKTLGGADASASESGLARCPSPFLIFCGALWVVSLGSLADQDEERWVHYLKYAALGAVVLGLPRIAMKAYGALKNRILDINCLMVIATVGACAIGDYSEAAAVVFLFGLSEWLEHLATAKARNALKSLLDNKPEVAIRAGSGERVSVEEVRIGDRLVVKAGEKVPLDAVVVEGASSVDESALTGESRPVQKKKGSAVSAGSINTGGGYMEVEASALAGDSAVARMVKLIEDAHASRSKTEKRVETFAKIYTPTVVFASVCLAVVPWILVSQDAMAQEEAIEWLYTSLVLLVVSCPCALVISTPVTYVSTLSTCATHNVLIRGGEHLETLGQVTAIGLDKTGTLTEGRFAVRDVMGPFAGEAVPVEMRRVLALMAAVEEKSTHPVASALVAYARQQGAEMGKVAKDLNEIAGQGVEAHVDGVQVQVGSRRLALNMGWLGNGAVQNVECFSSVVSSMFGRSTRGTTADKLEIETRVNDMESLGQTVCYLGVGGCLAAVFGVADAPRKEARQAVRELKALGVEPVMLTGDRRATAEAVAKQLGITRVQAELLPEDKVSAVADLKAEVPKGCLPCLSSSRGGVAMTGDGINDAAALAASSVGIAMGASGTQVAMENAQVVLMDSDLMKLVLSIRLGRYAVTKIKQNIMFSLVSKLVMIGLTISGYASLWGAIVADLGAMLLVTMNSSLVLSQRKKSAHKSSHNHGATGKEGGCCGGSAKTDIEQGGCGSVKQAEESGHGHSHRNGGDGHGHGIDNDHGHGHSQGGGHGHGH